MVEYIATRMKLTYTIESFSGSRPIYTQHSRDKTSSFRAIQDKRLESPSNQATDSQKVIHLVTTSPRETLPPGDRHV
jgi:hypothetical protein